MPPSLPLSGNSLVQFFEQGQFVGELTQYSCGYQSGDGESHSAYWPHRAYFCPVCGEIWGREVYTHQFQYRPIPPGEWVVETRNCVEHGDGQLLAKRGELDFVSKELLTREVLALLENFDARKY